MLIDLEIWPGEDEVSAADFASAIRKLGSLHGIKPSAVKLRLLPSANDILGSEYTETELRQQYDAALQEALKLLGVEDGGRGMCDYGMPSDYRAWLGFARNEAATFLRRYSQSQSKGNLCGVAGAIVEGTTSIAFTMRVSYAALPYTTAVALECIRQDLPTAGTR